MRLADGGRYAATALRTHRPYAPSAIIASMKTGRYTTIAFSMLTRRIMLAPMSMRMSMCLPRLLVRGGP
jgi:hypothetical protein